MKANLWVIANDNGWWTDDNGGSLFTSEEQAQKIMQKHGLEKLGCRVQLCGLDDDLAQMSKLYNE